MSSRDFHHFLSSTGLQDIGFKGTPVTWSNNGQGKKYVLARLDRMLTNQAWLQVFRDPILTHLSRQVSDHNPIILSHRPVIRRNNRFKFEKMWLSHPCFNNLLSSVWSRPVSHNPQFILFQKLKSFRTSLRQCNNETFGKLKQNIQLAEDSILPLQICMALNPSDATAALLAEAKSSFHNLLRAEETYWKQKSRVKWLEDGNRNTKFFHLSAKIRGNRNTIEQISFNCRFE